jgi:hypothetical protein
MRHPRLEAPKLDEARAGLLGEQPAGLAEAQAAAAVVMALVLLALTTAIVVAIRADQRRNGIPTRFASTPAPASAGALRAASARWLDPLFPALFQPFFLAAWRRFIPLDVP